MPDIEIRISDKRVQGGAFDSMARDAKALEADLRKVEKAADIDGTLDMDTTGLDQAEAGLRRIDGVEVDVGVEVDTGQLDRAEDDVRALDGLDVEVEVDVDSSALDRIKSKVSGAFDSVDFSGAGSKIAGKIEGAFDSINWGGVGSDAGRTVADGFSDSMEGISDSLPVIGAGIAAAAAVWGDDVAQGLSDGFNKNSNDLKTSLRTGVDPAEMRAVGAEAAALYGRGFGESLDEVRYAAGLVSSEIGKIDDDLDLSQATAELLTVTDAMEYDFPRAVSVAQRWIQNGLVATMADANDVMAYTAKEFPTAFEDVIDVLNEFGPVFAKMGYSGAEAAQVVGKAWEQGLLPNIDRGAELFEEFNIEITDLEGRAGPVFERLGLDAQGFHDALADGRGREAMAGLATELLNVEDASLRNDLAMQLLGTSIESASDTEAVLGFLAMGDAMDDVAGSAEDMASRNEEAATGFQMLQRDIEAVARAAGGLVSDHIADLYDAIGMVTGPVEEVGGGLLNVAQNLGLIPRPAEEVSAEFARLKAEAIENADAYTYNVGAQDELHAALRGTQGELGAAATATDTATDAVAELDAEFARLQERFSGDDAVRSLHDNLAALAEMEIKTTEDTYDLGAGFDTTTALGRDLEAQVQQVSLDLLDMAEAQRDGRVTALDMAQAQTSAEASLRDVARQLGLTEAETQDLINKYLQVPTDITTYVDEAGNALSKTDQIVVKLRGLDGLRTTLYVDTIQTTVYASRVAGGNAYRASGGVSTAAAGGVRDDLTVVGEHGPELVKLGVGAMVHTNPDSQRMLAGVGAGGPGVVNHYHINVQGSILRERELIGQVSEALDRGDFGQPRPGGR